MTDISGNSDDWTLLQGQHAGSPLLVRFRQFTGGVDRSAYPTRLNVFWSMRSADENGLAVPPEASALEVFENRLVDALDGHSVLSVVLTCNSKREFAFHTSDANGFIQLLSSLPQEADPYPIEIQSADDPSWDYDDTVTRTV